MLKKSFVFCTIILLISALSASYFRPGKSSAANDFIKVSGFSYAGKSALKNVNLGDINGDGYNDMAVAAPEAYGNYGEVNIHLGGKDATTPDYTFNKVGGSLTFFGSVIIPLGKFNNDNYDDTLICGGSSTIGNLASTCYVFYGGSTFNTTEDLTFVPPDTYGGRPCAIDVNGDGYTDILWSYMVTATSEKGINVFYGGTSPDNVADDNFDVAINKLAGIIKPAGDFNGDGYADFSIVSTNFAYTATYQDLYFGGSSLDKTADVQLTSPAYADVDNISYSNFINDINNDGMGEYAYWNNGTYEIYFGGSSVSANPDVTISAVDMSEAHLMIAGIGDINADGINDLLYSRWEDSDDSTYLNVIYGASDISGSKSPDLSLVTHNGVDSDLPFLSATNPLGNFTSDSGYEFLLIGGPVNNQSVYYYQIGSPILAPTLTLTSAEAITENTTPTFTGTATAASGKIITDIRYRINAGTWQRIKPLDGSFDSQVEDFSFAPTLEAGRDYIVEAKAVDSDSTETFEADYPSFTISIISDPIIPPPPPVYLPPAVTLTSDSSSTANTSPSFRGTATSDGTLTIRSVYFRIDYGAWQEATASDGSFDMQNEDYDFIAHDLAAGSHLLQAKAIDNLSYETLEAQYASYDINITTEEDNEEITYKSPSVTLNNYPEEFSSGTIHLSGSSLADERLNLQSVQYSFDKTNWFWAAADDHRFDASQEAFHLDLRLVNGSYNIFFRSSDSQGNYTPEADYAEASFKVNTILAAGSDNNSTTITDSPLPITKITKIITPDSRPMTFRDVIQQGKKKFYLYALISALLSAVSMATLAIGSLLTQYSVKEYIMVLANSFLTLFARHKKDKFGIVYDYSTDRPVNGALVNIFRFEDMKLMSSSLTDKKGHFYFTVSQGRYVISVVKRGYLFPSLSAQKAIRQIEEAKGIYFGQTIEINDEAKVINVKIPIDPSIKATGKKHTLLKLLNSTTIRLAMMILATVISIAMLIFDPSTASYVLAGLYSVLWILEFFIQDHELKFSRIIDANTREPIDLALIRVMDKNGKLRKTYVSDYQGRVIPYIGNARDKIIIEKSSYQNIQLDKLKSGFLENKKFYLNSDGSI